MESVLKSSLSPAIQSQEVKIEEMRQVIARRAEEGRNNRQQRAEEARHKTAQIRSLTYPFSSNIQPHGSSSGSLKNNVSYLRNQESGAQVYQQPTETGVKIAETARQENIKKLIDFLV